MGLIVLAAKLALCESCHSHGTIIYGDGTKSEELLTKEDALAEVTGALLADKIVEAEAECLRKALYGSNLRTQKVLEAIRKVICVLQKPAGEEAEQMPWPAAMPSNRTLH